MYFSKKNKNHIFNVISDLVLKETGTDIHSDQTYTDMYRFKYTLIFERSLSDNLVDLNKELIDEIAPLFINDIQSKYKEQKITIHSENKMKEKQTTKEFIQLNHSNDFKEKIISSGDRISGSINRFHYLVKLTNEIQKITFKEISIPEEQNILLGNPVICVQFKMDSKEYNNFCVYQKSFVVNEKKYNVYHSSTQLEIPFQNTMEIKILTNTLMSLSEESDQHKISKMKEIKFNDQNYLCISTENNNCKEKDLIGIYCNNKLIKTVMISMCKDNYLLVENENILYDSKNQYSFIELNYQNNIRIEYC